MFNIPIWKCNGQCGIVLEVLEMLMELWKRYLFANRLEKKDSVGLVMSNQGFIYTWIGQDTQPRAHAAVVNMEIS